MVLLKKKSNGTIIVFKILPYKYENFQGQDYYTYEKILFYAWPEIHSFGSVLLDWFCQISGIYISLSYLRLAFLFWVECFDWVQQDILKSFF